MDCLKKSLGLLDAFFFSMHMHERELNDLINDSVTSVLKYPSSVLAASGIKFCLGLYFSSIFFFNCVKRHIHNRMYHLYHLELYCVVVFMLLFSP